MSSQESRLRGMRHVIDARESGSQDYKCWFFISVVKRLTVRISYPYVKHIQRRHSKEQSGFAQDRIQVIGHEVDLMFDR